MRQQIVAEALAWRDTPYTHQGRVKGVGVDCIGFVAGVGINVGLLPADLWSHPAVQPHLGYSRLPDAKTLRKLMDIFATRIPVLDARPGDVLVMRFTADIQHLGIMVDEDMMIHAYMTAGKVAMHRMGASWRSRVSLAYRFPEVV